MCINCYKEYGSPVSITPLVKKALPMVEHIYDWNCVGSNLHIVIDDFNIEDHNIDYCIKESIPENLHEASDRDLQVEADLAALMLSMTIDERATLLALHDGWITL